jgi:hypothetical protein
MAFVKSVCCWLTLWLSVGCTGSMAGSTSSEMLFNAVGTDEAIPATQRAALDTLRHQAPIVRARLVRVRLEIIQRSRAGSKVILNLFSDTDLPLNTSDVTRRAENDFSWTGGDPKTTSYAMIIVKGQDLTGSVRDQGKLYQIRPVGDGLHSIAEVNESHLLEEPPYK